MTSNRGFTLIEVLASIFILFLVSTVFFQFFIMSQKTTTNNEDKLVAVNLAKSVMEQLNPESNVIPSSGKYGCQKNNNTDEIECEVITDDTKDYRIKLIVQSKNEVGLNPVEIKILQNGKSMTTLKGLVEL